MSDIRIYHNPRCSKSRESLKALADLHLEAEVIEYLKDPPTVAELDRICTQLGVEPVEIIRTKEKKFRELGLSLADDRGRREWLKILSENPILIERPIVVKGNRAAIGRPVDQVIDLLHN
jgi:arsenate reductase